MLGFFKKALESRVYGLDHALLNIQLPPATLWMNMGYWKNTEDFPEACQALLDLVLEAGLGREEIDSQSVSILDVGCGCGDQSIRIASLKRGEKSSFSAGRSFSSASASASTATSWSGFDAVDNSANAAISRRTDAARFNKPPRALVDTYVGITLQASQAEIGQQRIRLHQQQNSRTQTTATDIPSQSNYHIFCADAATPSTWTGDLQTSISKMIPSSSLPSSSNPRTTWLLALDTLYHFQPSRLSILHYANTTLRASFMAFDLLLADQSSVWQRLKLRLVCLVTGAPFANFLTCEQYVQLLVEAGYDRDRVEIVDISSDVFPGVTRFLQRRIREARPFGLKLGKFRGAKTVFGWWARSGIVRGVVVVARK
ncbi:Uncharacterized protein PECH_006420 [Penicillium ucsense]|uniref:Methyltransferase domain-containing protein n=1 Tax=Penicillium ucsense TaxID=2839758 RepID=A0A8J8WKY6_9EURO|nr:Uncharacterized protein PECM_004252 [Penicillium ucsense]KAF7735620.1 Uncharacterized protein PECH_006420 [Penicillium ucsense]